MDLNHTFVTSDHHFRDWKNSPLHKGSEEDDAQHIALWNSVVGKDDPVLYVGDFYESVPVTCKGGVADLQDLLGKLNGQIVLIKGNHDKMDDSVYRLAFKDVPREAPSRRAHDLRARASGLCVAAHDARFNLRLREVARVEAAYACGGDPSDGSPPKRYDVR